MSWAPDDCETDAGGLLRHVRDGYACDKWFGDEKNTADLISSEGMWKKNGLIVVPDVADLRERCLYLHHDTPFAGHLGRDRTMHFVQQTDWWPGLEKHVRHMCLPVTSVSVTRHLMRSLLACCNDCLCLISDGSG